MDSRPGPCALSDTCVAVALTGSAFAATLVEASTVSGGGSMAADGASSRRRSAISRSAATLLLALVLTDCGSGPGSVTGVVVAGPACPVASGASSPACSAEPLTDLPLTIVRVSDETVVGQQTTGA